MYELIKATDTAFVLGGKKEKIDTFTSIEAAFDFLKSQEGVTFFFGEIDHENNAGDCAVSFGPGITIYSVEPIKS